MSVYGYSAIHRCGYHLVRLVAARRALRGCVAAHPDRDARARGRRASWQGEDQHRAR